MEELKLIKRGAESLIYETYFLGIHAILKKRIPKSYRHPILDKKINSERTLLEAKLIYSALEAGVNAPAVLLVNKDEYSIIMEYIDGITVRDYLFLNNKQINCEKLGEEIGIIVGKIHKARIAHGDLTTNNLIIKHQTNEIFIIDFGLAKRSEDIEDYATDVHVFLRSLESIHPDKKETLFNGFLKGYSQIVDFSDLVMKTLKDIRMRGRYVEERRNKNSDGE
ncbi:Kae1-associated kinase Bud32 [Acidianus sulfidivorans JP7]|uniref:non-specific serine/threonine protein kinase n=1 Tax=Acidianus sulfidivorans JP7 TaxID=619593 RepID=A0A2U9IMA5_9CREN|nr:Kae1-associated kinase Bud32 [Acidianus sulfidivorans]AWR97151.1 Kae1-associated kinase Bud32 [Acidianus sulfidivorans JP7]